MEGVQSVTQPVNLHRRNDTLWNVLTFVILLSTLCTALAFLVIFVNPQVPFNPFPPAVLAMNGDDQPGLTATAAPTQKSSPSTSTPEPSQTPLPTQQSTTDNTSTSTISTPIAAASPAAPDVNPANYAFSLQGTPAPVSTTLIKNEVGCEWQGVAGQALDTRGSPIVGLLIKITGTLEGKPVDLTGLTGTETRYGDGGFELQLSSSPVNSSGELSIQLLDNSGLPLSQPFRFDTNADCKKNLILVNFRQVKD